MDHHAVFPGFIDGHIDGHVGRPSDTFSEDLQDTNSWMMYACSLANAGKWMRVSAGRLAIVEAIAGTTRDYHYEMETCQFIHKTGSQRKYHADDTR